MRAARAGRIVVFAKEPRPGRVKTRMTPPLTPEQAAELYARLLADVLEATLSIAIATGLEPVLAVQPARARARLARAAPSGYRVVGQRGADLAGRMAWATAEAAATGAPYVLLRGSDSPALGAATVEAALAGLGSADLVLCPDRDGGYNLVGLKQPHPRLFQHPMSTGSVLEDTLANARALGLRAQLLEPGFDLDEVGDLRWLAQARVPGVTDLCPRTLAFLDEQRLWRHLDAAP